MANWLERARRQIPQGVSSATARTDERTPTAVTAVPKSGKAEISRRSIGSNGSVPVTDSEDTPTTVATTPYEEASIRAWFTHIDETDEPTIADVLNACRTDADARRYFLRRAGEVSPPKVLDGDDRRRCDQCANLTERGLCLAARRGEIGASRSYEPARDLLRRCEGYAPGAGDADRRPGRIRWPGLTPKESNDANDR